MRLRQLTEEKIENNVSKVLQFIFGSKFEQRLKRLTPIVAEINSLEPEIQKLSNEELKQQTKKFKDLLANGKTLDDILPEAFATIREVSIRTMGLRHYDVQMMGGLRFTGEISQR